MQLNNKFDRRKAIKSFLGFGLLTFVPFKGFSLQEDCLTTDDILGPFFVENGPNTNVLAPEKEGVARLYITGTVYAKDCTTPIPNALIEVWQADFDGEYDDNNYRASIYSDQNGNYSFETIQPGKYLNGTEYRPSHIHFKITHLDNPSLVTQLYFEGDTSIENDPWASSIEALNRIIPLSTDQNQNLNGVFDIYLNIDVNSVDIAQNNKSDIKSSIKYIAPTPIVNQFELSFYNNKNCNIKIDICDVFGRIQKTIFKQKLSKGLHNEKFKNLNLKKGIYIIRLLENNQPIDSKRVLIN